METVSFRPCDMGQAYLLLTWEKLTRKIGSDELDKRQKLVAGLLCSDERMKSVWRVVFQTNAAGGFSYPAKFEALNPYRNALPNLDKRIELLRRLSDEFSAAELRTMLSLRARYLEHEKSAAVRIANMTPFDRQLLASRYLYAAAISAVRDASVVNDADLSQLNESLEDAIANLRELPGLSPLVEVSDTERELRKLLLFSHIGFENGPFHVERHTGDARVRGFVIAVGLQMKALFGQSFYGSIATIANVSFERIDLTGAKVREMLRRTGKQSSAKRRT